MPARSATAIDDRGPVPAPEPAARRSPSETGAGEHESPHAGMLDLAAAIGLMLAAVGFVIGARAISDNSFLTHLANGREIMSGAGIPRTDPYSFTAAGEPVTVQSWLASLIYAGLVDTVGDWSVRILNGVLCALIAGGTWAISAPARRLLPRVVLTGGVLVLGAGNWSPRPLLFGLLGLVALLLVLQERLPAPALIPIMWIWVNTHGSFPLAIVLVGAVGAGRMLDGFATTTRRPGLAALRPSRWLPQPETRVMAWTVGGILVGALNPLGPRLLWFPVHLLGRSEALEDVIEWRSPSFDRPAEWAFLLLVFAFLVALRQGAPWRSLLPGFVFTVMALLAVRNLNVASLVLVFCAAPMLGRSSWFTLDGSARGFSSRVVAVVSVGIMALAAAVAILEGPLDLRRYPMDEVDWLAERDLVATDGVELVHREVVGNYLGLRFGSEARVFMDDRFDFYPMQVIDDHDALLRGGDYAEVLDRWSADVVLWEADSSFSAWLDEEVGWEIVAGAVADETADEASPDWIIACRVDSDVYQRCTT